MGGTGTEVDTAKSKFGGASALFVDTAHSQLQVPAHEGFLIGFGNFTIDFWINSGDSSTDGARNRRIFKLDGPAGNSTGNLQIVFGDGTNNFIHLLNTGIILSGSIAVADRRAIFRL